MANKELTTSYNLVDKLKKMEGLLDIIEEDLESNVDSLGLTTNVIEIFPDVLFNWKLMQEDKEMTLYEMVDICEEWVDDLAVSMIKNMGKFQNKKLAKHIGEVVIACRTVVKVTYSWLDSINP